VHDHCSA